MTERTLVSTNDTKIYRWDADNRLRAITHDVQWMTAQYEYTGDRRQAYQNGDPQSSRYHTSGGLPLNENARDGTDVSFIQGHQILGLYNGSDFFYHISDGLSSVRVLIDATGSAVANFGTNEFGIPEPPAGPRADLDFMTYQGSLGVRNDSSGLYAMTHRYYDASLGRWLNQDPIGFDGGLNLYVGMGNNPINGVDPDGLKPVRDVSTGIFEDDETGEIYDSNCAERHWIKMASQMQTIERAQALIRRYNPGATIPLGNFQTSPFSRLVASLFGGYAMETNLATGSVNINPEWFSGATLPGIVAALANETYHYRNPKIHGRIAELESAKFEESVLKAWEKELQSECGPFKKDERLRRAQLQTQVAGAINRAPILIRRYGGTPTY